MQLTKLEAALRQLTTAIELFFEQRDPVSVRTLVGAANRVLADLVEDRAPGTSWRAAVVATIPQLPAKDVYDILDKTQNFLKHADRDPSGIELFVEEENEDLIFVSCLECGALGASKTYQMQAFEIWYLAAYPGSLPGDSPLALEAASALPIDAGLDRREKIEVGARFLAKHQGLLEKEDAV